MKHSYAYALGAVLVAGPLVVAQYVPDQGRSGERVQQPSRVTGDRSTGQASMGQDQARIERLSKLIGQEVETRDGAQFGEIENFIIDTSGSRVTHVIIDVDDNLNLQREKVPVPYRTLDFQRSHQDDQPVVLMIDRAQLRSTSVFDDNVPGFDQEQSNKRPAYRDSESRNRDTSFDDDDKGDTNYPGSTGNPRGSAGGDPDDFDQSGRVDSDFNDTNYPGATGNPQGRAAGSEDADRYDDDDDFDRSTRQTEQDSSGRADSPRRTLTVNDRTFIKATDLRGAEVQTNRNAELGEVEDILVHLPTGNIPFVAISTGGVAGSGDKLYAVPLQATTIRTAGDEPVLALNIDAQRLEQAPTINQERWPTQFDSNMNRDIYAFYSVQEPDWVYGFSGSDTTTSNRTAQPQQPRSSGQMRDMSVDSVMADWPQASQKAAREMIQKYGQPDAVTPTMVVWKDSGPWKCTTVYKDEVPHSFPAPHSDVLEQGISYKVPADMLDDLARFNGSIIVDRTKGVMCARCAGEPMNFLALNLAHEIVTGKRQVEDARQFLASEARKFKQGESSEYTQRLMFEGSSQNAADPDRAMEELDQP